MSQERRRQDGRQWGEDEHPRREEPQSVREFELALGEEVSVSAEFELPLCVLVARSNQGWSPEVARHVVSILRAADLIARPEPTEFAVALPNTEPDDAEVVERRLRDALPGAALGIAVHRTGDTVSDLLNRARTAADRKNS